MTQSPEAKLYSKPKDIVVDPIKLSKARQKIRAAQIRLLGIEKIAAFIGRVTMSSSDKMAVMNILNSLHDDADNEYQDAIDHESLLLGKMSKSDSNKN
ncbi:MAG: hypothetical protein AAF195_04610 [Pseudomonadota bacterium]